MSAKDRFAVAIVCVLAACGVGAAAYVLVHERLTPPGTDTYDVRLQFTAADGVEPGLGQPVRVAGVQVGTVSGAGLHGGVAEVTLQIDRADLPAVYRDARASLVPISPLKDLQVELNPGSRSAGRLRPGERIGVARTTSPTDLSELLRALDADTRDYLTAFIASIDEGTRGRVPGVVKAFRNLGPTARQVAQITRALDRRRFALARLVHNMRLVTRDAAVDGALRRVVSSGHRVLGAVADQQANLERAVQRLPQTVHTADAALLSAARFSRQLTPTLQALTPAVKRTPAALDALQPFAAATNDTLRDDIRPLIRSSQPLVRRLAQATSDLRAIAPAAITVLKTANYALNELAYNPSGDDEGLLFWFPWWFHNYLSLFSTQDAHGSAARAMILVNCQQLTGLVALGDILKTLTGTYSLCKG